MGLGFAAFAIGYVIFYWGLHHMPQYKDARYGFWHLFGLGTLFPNATLPTGQPFQFKA